MTVWRAGHGWFGGAPRRGEGGTSDPVRTGSRQGPVPAHLVSSMEEIQAAPPVHESSAHKMPPDPTRRRAALGRGYRQPAATPPGAGEQRLLGTPGTNSGQAGGQAELSSSAAPPCPRCGFELDRDPRTVCTACGILDVAGADDELLIGGLLSLRRRGVELGAWAAARRRTWRGCVPLSPAQACRLIALRYRGL